MRHNSQKNPSPVMSTINPGLNPNATHQNRRVMVLNKLFMNHITDLMATGEVAPKLLGRGIEITHVKVAPDFRLVNVYWYAQSDFYQKDETEKILKNCAGHLQHELTQLRVIGHVPPINFVKNKFAGMMREVEERLATVDFGEDYEPTAFIRPILKTPILQTTLDPELKAKITEVDTVINQDESDNNDQDEECYIIDVPEMNQSVLGFNHDSVMKKVCYLIFIY